MKPTRTPQNLGSPFNLLDFGAPEGTEIPGLGTAWEPFLEGLTHAWLCALEPSRALAVDCLKRLKTESAEVQ